MSRFVTEPEIKDICAPWWDQDTESVTIRRYSGAARDRLNKETIRVSATEDDEGRVEVSAEKIPIMLAGIKSWTFEDDNGKLMPVNRKWCGKLDPDDIDYIVAKIRELNKGRTAEEQATFREGADSVD